MQIGFVEKRELVVSGEKKSWFEMIIKAPFVREFSMKMSKNENKKNEKSPDYFLYYRTNVKKGENYRDTNVGGLWLKISNDGKTQFMSGHIETPMVGDGRINIALFKAKPNYDNEKVDWMYDVVWNIKKEDDKDDEKVYDKADNQAVDIDEDNPF
jgi:uncharacterized protein (DUF736 family)